MWFRESVLLLVLQFTAHSSQHANVPSSAYILESESLPDDLNFMPTLSNGHLGFTVFSDSIFVNGVYNGKGGLSHRARIKNFANYSVNPIDGEGYSRESYKLDLFNGIFEWKQSNSEIETTIRTYPHRFFNRAIVNEIFVQRKSNTSAELRSIKLRIDMHPGSDSEDFPPVTVSVDSGDAVVFCQLTKDMENAEFQSFRPTVCAAMNILPSIIELFPNQTKIYQRAVVTIAETPLIAIDENYDVQATSEETMLKLHSDQWNAFWEQFHIDLDSNLDLSRTINAGIFYLANSLPSPVTNKPCGLFYGLSPVGLGRGNLDADYQGHNFWDTEIWMLPVVNQMSTNWTKDLLSYRYRNLNAALDNANRTGFIGARFPWESAFTGTEVTNPCCPEVALQQFHITADIAFALRHYFIISNDTEWMKKEGCELSKRIAEFWMGRVSLDQKTEKYDIKYVMGPDEYHINVTNNAFTNVVVQHALELVHLTQTICDTDSLFATTCLNIAQNLKVPYDNEMDYNPQYDGYTPNIKIKQADTVLLSYPLLYPIKTSTLSNNLRIYEKATRPSGPAMTWSIFAIGYLDEGNEEKAKTLFEKGYKDYIREPFKVWSEVIRSEKGASNFLTGIGGFLQAVINGYGGIRFHSNRMEIRKPFPLPGTKSSLISGLKYQGSTFTLKLSVDPSIIVEKIKNGQQLFLVDEFNKTISIEEGHEYFIKTTSSIMAY